MMLKFLGKHKKEMFSLTEIVIKKWWKEEGDNSHSMYIFQLTYILLYFHLIIGIMKL